MVGSKGGGSTDLNELLIYPSRINGNHGHGFMASLNRPILANILKQGPCKIYYPSPTHGAFSIQGGLLSLSIKVWSVFVALRLKLFHFGTVNNLPEKGHYHGAPFPSHYGP